MKKLLADIWTRLPASLQHGAVRLSQSRFTVGVSAVLFNDSREILLLRHRFRENPAWALPGGFVEQDEQLENAIIRELREETGYEIENPRLVSVWCPRSQHLDVCFTAQLTKGTLRLDDVEILEGRFFAADALPADVTADHRRSIEIALSKWST